MPNEIRDHSATCPTCGRYLTVLGCTAERCAGPPEERKLTVGDTFRIRGLRPVAEVVHAKDNQPPTVNTKRLSVDRFALTARTVAPWTETQPGGWERRHETVLDRKVGDMSDVVWRVLGARLGGGGTGMGDHDRFGDEWQVLAEQADGAGVTLHFTQDSDWYSAVKSSDIELVRP